MRCFTPFRKIAYPERFLLGSEDDKLLRWKILDTLDRERQHTCPVRLGPAAEIKKLNAREAKSTQHDEEIDKLEQEKEALLRLRLISTIGRH